LDALEHLQRAKGKQEEKQMAVHFVLLSLNTLGLFDISLTTYLSNEKEK
jgi:hypothetical protein